MRGGVEVTLRVEGRDGRYQATAVYREPERIREALALLLARFPQDAPYYGVRLSGDKGPVPEDLARAARNTVMVEARLVP